MQRDSMKDTIRYFICNDLLQQPDFPLTDDTPLIQGGLIDSFAVVDLVLFIETTFDIVLPITDLEEESLETLNAIEALIHKTLSTGQAATHTQSGTRASSRLVG